MRYKVAGHNTWYTVEPLTRRQAEAVGCGEATHRVIGPRTGTVYYGRFHIKGRLVKVPGTSGDLYGTKCTFDGFEQRFYGYLIEEN
jgi:hypothetical protein